MKRIEYEVAFEELMTLIEESFQQGLTATITVTGNSMVPLLHHKQDSVVLSACDPQSLKRGDVPLYKRENGQYILHRIVKVNPDSFTLAGDAQSVLEYDLPKTNVRAVMTAFTRNGKTITCQHLGYRFYVMIWLWLRPVRPYILALCRRLQGGHHK